MLERQLVKIVTKNKNSIADRLKKDIYVRWYKIK